MSAIARRASRLSDRRWSVALVLAGITSAGTGCGSSRAPSASERRASTEPVPAQPAPLQPAPTEPAPAAATPIADEYRARAAQIIAAATADHQAYERLAQLTDRIGHRLSGTPALARAVTWAAKLLADDGHERVHTEKVMVPHWVRGAESGELRRPEVRALRLIGLGGTVATPKKGLTAEVVVAASFAELEAMGDAVVGKIVLWDAHMPAYSDERGSGYRDVVGLRTEGASRAAKQGAVASLVRSLTAHSLSTPHTGAVRYTDGVTAIPAAALTTEDADLIARLVRAGETVEVHLLLSGKMLPDVESANVIGELRGRELPDEVVLIGAHLDSWDVGQGAHDDGAGCAIVMQALTVLRRLGLTPRRTIRVVLFTNEENGLRGAKGYGVDHAAEIADHVAAFESDGGGFEPRGFTLQVGADGQELALTRMTDLLTLLAPLGADRLEVGDAGADLTPLTDAGVPGLGHEVDGSRYFDIHHTEADTLDKVDPDALARNVAVMAVTAYVLADAAWRLDR